MKVENRNIKYPRIEFRSGEMHFILPPNMEYNAIMDKYKDWIDEKQNEINNALKHSQNLQLENRDLNSAKKLALQIIDRYSVEYGLVVNKVIFRDLISKWGSCSSQGNLTFNKMIAFLPTKPLRYVVFHEIMHLIERKHSNKFWSLISEKFPDYKEIEKDLFAYWFLINKERGI